MENVIHRLTLDLTGPDTIPRVEVQQDNARSLSISLTQGGRPYWIAEGVTAVFSARKPDGKPLFNGCTIEKNRVRYDFTDQTTNVAGIVECEILLYDSGGKRLASSRFELAIDELIHRDGDVPESAPEISALTQMVAAGTAMLEDLAAALGELEGVEEILTQARAAAEAASNSEVAARGHAKTAADGAADALTLAGQANSAAQQANKYAYEAGNHAKAAEESAQRAEEAVAGVSAGKIDEAINDHETNLAAHADIRNALEDQRNRVNAALNSDDVTLDQMAEIVAYIKSNKTLIDAITTSKVSVADIVNNIVTNVSNKPLSAAMGVSLAGEIDSVRSSLAGYQPKGEYLLATALGAAIDTALAEAKKSGAFDGADGADGRGIKSIAHTSGNGAVGTTDTYTITYTDDTRSTFNVRNGANGKNGADGQDGRDGSNGKDGNGIKTAVLNADYTLTLTFDNGTSYTTPSIRGATGNDGKDGDPGADGQDGSDGVGIASIEQTTTSTADGGNNVFTITLTNGNRATFTVKNGSKGSTGSNGKDGKTPIKGTDYYTDADKTEMVNAVLAALPRWEGGSY